MEVTDETYFHVLPNEIKVYLFSLLNTQDLINFTTAYHSEEYLTFDKKVIRDVNFYKANSIQITKFITNKLRCEYITKLNINCVYWIPASDLRKALRKLCSLECLLALDSTLGMSEQDCRFYATIPKLRKIAVPLNGMDFCHASANNFPQTIVSVCFHIYSPTITTLILIRNMLSKVLHLQEVWVINRHIEYSTINQKFLHLPTCVQTMVLYDYAFPFNRTHRHLTKIFETKKRAREIWFEQTSKAINIYEKIDVKHDSVWDTLLNDLHCDFPFGKRDAELMSYKRRTLDNINFKELNFAHADAVCSERLQRCITEVLLSPNTKLMKKVSFNFCICEDKTPEENLGCEPRVKKFRNSENNNCQELFTCILKNCDKLEELEIWPCQKSLTYSLSSLYRIQHLKFLKALTLTDIPFHIGGNFLVEICRSCHLLNYLRIKLLKINSKFNSSVCAALQLAVNLKDFRFEHGFIPVDQLFSALHQCENLKLERIYLKCDNVPKFSVLPFENFLKTAKNLVLVFIVVSEIPKTSLRIIQRTLNQYKISRQQIFFAVQNERIFSGKLPIPDIHKYDMVELNTRVSVLDLFNDFV